MPMSTRGTLTHRLAVMSDADDLLRWRNDPETRRQSVNQAEVTAVEHRAWLEKVLEGEVTKLFVCDIDGKRACTFRVDHRKTELEISWTVAPEFRGRGIGIQVVTLAAQTAIVLRGTGSGIPIVARIRKDNVASQKAAIKAGLCKVREEGDLMFWEIK